MGFGGNSGGGGSIAGSSDAAMNNPADNDVLKFDSATSKWKNGPLSANLAQVPTVINHGATASTARPSVVGPVFWFGTVTPENIADGDFYWEVTSIGGGGGSGGSGFVGAFNSFTAPHRAVSLRRLLTSYTGPAIKVRRSSDNTELDIGFASNGSLDTTGLLDFVGNGSGYVTTWYDQSGHSYHLTQTTAASQPRIVNNGVVDSLNGKPCVVFDGTDDFIWSNITGLYAAGSATVSAVLSGYTASSAIAFSESSTTGHFYRMIRNSNGAWNVYAVAAANTYWNSTTPNTTTFSNNIQRHFFYSDTGSQISTWLNGSVQHDAIAAVRSGGAPNVNSTAIGAHVNAGVGASFFSGSVQELVAWGSLETASRSAISSSQTTYWGVV